MLRVAVVALPDCVVSDLATPIDVFGRVRLSDGRAGYRVRVCGTEAEVAAGPIRIATDHGVDELCDADTIVVPGSNHPLAPAPRALIIALKAAYDSGIRIASICTGAFVLAAAGVLDGKRATTHWLGAVDFRNTYPAVDLDPDVLYVDEGQILTSAGASAGLDLCLHLVARDYGSAVAAESARLAVAPLHRAGGQAQFILRNRRPTNTGLDGVLAWIEAHAHGNLTLGEIAAYAATSTRTLNRRFQAETGQTPIQWLTGVRVRHAQQLLEGTSDNVESIGRRVGFESAANFREQFKRLVGVSPQAYRTAFRDQASR
ncbi:AraC family transcriptional regulator [Mycobacterium malmoense]|uniref:GlxA family transcriptional regulator n=1 Tax=Mycobacterium malmoense TaxID=1780 RepID=UPI00080B57F7|nr:helix-turn-helix domain-containing protein [Mycobacterium malmoense]OCB32679.1 AraC family transcriptional regulator [Mycobacterium malmoense]